MNNIHSNNKRYCGYGVPALARLNNGLYPGCRTQDDLDKVFGGAFRGLLSPWVGGSAQDVLGGLMPKMDVTSTDKVYDVTVEVPGVDPDNVTIEVKDELLLIRGEKRQEAKDVDVEQVKSAEVAAEQGKDNDGENKANKPKVHFSERYYGFFERAVSLPDDADSDNISASYKNGVLHINIPKKVPAVPQAKTIVINKE